MVFKECSMSNGEVCMINGVLLNPDMSYRKVSFEKERVAEFLGGSSPESVEVLFKEGGVRMRALFSPEASAHGAGPNPVASLGVNRARTGNSAFFTDPTSGVCGPVIIVSLQGEDLTDHEVEEIQDGIRAAENYCEDYPEEYTLWNNAVRNLGKMDS